MDQVYWNIGEIGREELALKGIEGVVDENVGQALREYIEDDGFIGIEFCPEGLPTVEFSAGVESEFKCSIPLEKLLVRELEYIAGDGSRKEALISGLLMVYREWMRND